MFVNNWTKFEGKGLPKAMTQSIMYIKVINDAITDAP